jgi:hypothetical protein
MVTDDRPTLLVWGQPDLNEYSASVGQRLAVEDRMPAPTRVWRWVPGAQNGANLMQQILPAIRLVSPLSLTLPPGIHIS